jgi:hypothetical protein
MRVIHLVNLSVIVRSASYPLRDVGNAVMKSRTWAACPIGCNSPRGVDLEGLQEADGAITHIRLSYFAESGDENVLA